MNGTGDLGAVFSTIERDLVAAVSAFETGCEKASSRAILASKGASQSPKLALEAEGFGLFSDALGDTARLAEAFETVARLGLPTVFVFAFPGTLAFAETAVAKLTTVGDYEILEDFWGFSVAPGSSGWPPHRGHDQEVFPREQPTLVNLWGSVGDAPADRACMHAIPWDDDPGYPKNLKQIEGPLAAVRALPTVDGDLLYWNANLLHWGGPSSRFATVPRRALTATLVLRGAFPELRRVAASDLRGRLDAIARQIGVYGRVPAEIAAWAAFTSRGVKTRLSK